MFVNLLTGQGFNNAAQGDSFDGIENLTGSIYNDYFIGTNGANTLNGGDANDILLGALGADSLIGGVGIDTASYEDNQGAVFVNLTLGQGFGNAAEGDSFSSIENLVGTVFYDTFIGDANANRLDGALGNDTLTGAGGADVFVFDTAFAFNNIDEITDFTHGTDHIELDDAIFSGLVLGRYRRMPSRSAPRPRRHSISSTMQTAGRSSTIRMARGLALRFNSPRFSRISPSRPVISRWSRQAAHWLRHARHVPVTGTCEPCAFFVMTFARSIRNGAEYRSARFYPIDSRADSPPRYCNDEGRSRPCGSVRLVKRGVMDGDGYRHG